MSHRGHRGFTEGPELKGVLRDGDGAGGKGGAELNRTGSSVPIHSRKRLSNRRIRRGGSAPDRTPRGPGVSVDV